MNLLLLVFRLKYFIDLTKHFGFLLNKRFGDQRFVKKESLLNSKNSQSVALKLQKLNA